MNAQTRTAHHTSALVLFSGGQDSTTCLAHALARYPRVETLGFDYGQRHSVELQARTAAEAAVASSVVLSIQGKLRRVKLCGGEDCRWAFYDESRNGSRQWCSMEVCGNRQKARTYRARREA